MLCGSSHGLPLLEQDHSHPVLELLLAKMRGFTEGIIKRMAFGKRETFTFDSLMSLRARPLFSLPSKTWLTKPCISECPCNGEGRVSIGLYIVTMCQWTESLLIFEDAMLLVSNCKARGKRYAFESLTLFIHCYLGMY